ncbi:MAG: hypothetical protein J6112_03250 [Clostridia bacterium]|nr:hypothetical protein [Clostridia bacterium]
MKTRPTLTPTGDEAFDKKCADLWSAESYDELVAHILLRIAKIDDFGPLDEGLRMLRVLRGNEILTEAIRQAKELGSPADYIIELMGLYISDDGCQYNDKTKAIRMSEYLRDPDALLCDSCSATYRKYFCGITIRPR